MKCSYFPVKLNFKHSILSLIFLLILVLISCKKDENSKASKAIFRITEYKFYDDDKLAGKINLDYSGERITGVHQFDISPGDTIMKEVYKILIEYPDNNHAIKSLYVFENQYWDFLSREEVFFHGENIDSCLDYSYSAGTWELVNKFTRQYDGDKIVSNITFNIYSDWRPMMKQEFSYDGDRLASVMNFSYSGPNDWKQIYKYILNYSGTHIQDIVASGYESNSWVNTKKNVYSYLGDHVSSIEEFVFSNGVWNTGSITYNYTFDTDGNLASWNAITAFSNSTLVYTYEKAKGNWIPVIETDGSSWLYYNTCPMPTKAAPLIPGMVGKLLLEQDLLMQGKLK
jgi:hypothetical protein